MVILGIFDSEKARKSAFARDARSSDTILYVGRFADINGTTELFAAIPAILARAPQARFVIVGGVPDNRRSHARWIKRWNDTAPDSARSRVHFAGWLGSRELTRLYSAAAVLISPS